MKKILFLIAFVLFNACKPVYKTLAFEETPKPAVPNYADESFWAVLPEKYPEPLTSIVGAYTPKDADVFFIYPTLLTDKKDPSWNADVRKEDIRKEVITSSVKYQASAFAKVGNLYVPFYRQSHYKIYVSPYDKQEEGSRNLAYTDIQAAFNYYLEHYHQGQPIIIASHSQGSIMAAMLLKEFFDGTALQEKLVAAYIPGVKISDDMFEALRKMEQPSAIGGYVTWNSYKQNKLPSNYETYYKGGTVSNPISWDSAKSTALHQHKGVLYSDGKVYPNALKIELIDGLLWASLPKVPKRFWFSFLKNYHFADINLFWKDIEQNSLDRLAAWKTKTTSDAR